MAGQKDNDWQECTFNVHDEQKEHEIRQKIEESMRQSGQTPEPIIQDFAWDSDLDNWEFRCDSEDPSDPDNIIGVGNLWPNKGDWYSCTIQKLYVWPEFRRMGIGQDLTEGLIERGRNKINPDLGVPDCAVLTADIDSDNKPSKELFKDKGFSKTFDFKVPGTDQDADVVRMELELD